MLSQLIELLREETAAGAEDGCFGAQDLGVRLVKVDCMTSPGKRSQTY